MFLPWAFYDIFDYMNDTTNTTAKITCPVCFRHCILDEGQTGNCLARQNQNGKSVSLNYGRISSIALDPIEKKPLYHFHPGSPILSVGSFGCNLHCPFCQNHGISQTDDVPCRELSPEQLVSIALDLKEQHGNIGIAFTYNEPLINYEYILDCAVLAKSHSLAIVLVSNGTAEPEILRLLLPYVDAMNIDVKGFSDAIYRRLGGSFASVKETVELAHGYCHIEITSLIVSGFNDSVEAMSEQAVWLASLDPAIPLHITRAFPNFRMPQLQPTPVSLMRNLQDAAKAQGLKHVYLGNV